MAAALALGAAGALLGTRLLVALDALGDPSVAKAVIEADGEDTERSRVSDIARGAPWPAKYSARTIRNPFFDHWRGREEELAADPDAQQAYRMAVARPEPTYRRTASGPADINPPMSRDLGVLDSSPRPFH